MAIGRYHRIVSSNSGGAVSGSAVEITDGQPSSVIKLALLFAVSRDLRSSGPGLLCLERKFDAFDISKQVAVADTEVSAVAAKAGIAI